MNAVIRVCAVVVTYHPDLKRLETLLASICPQVYRVAIVDNSASERVAQWLAQTPYNKAVRVYVEVENTGVGAAHNRGIQWAVAESATHVLLLDQDSIPDAEMVSRLVDAWRDLEERRIPVSALGPYFHDQRSQVPAYFVRYGLFGKRRIYCRDSDESEVIECDFLISSGALIPVGAIRTVGVMDASLFIDHVDTEWFLRAKTKGLTAYGVCRARMFHSLGDDRIRFWLGRWFAIARYRPLRYYYIFRNSILLYQRRYVPIRWVLFDIARLAGLFIVHTLFGSSRAKNLRMILTGIWDGLRGRSGVFVSE